jgi:hypothetical protein
MFIEIKDVLYNLDNVVKISKDTRLKKIFLYHNSVDQETGEFLKTTIKFMDSGEYTTTITRLRNKSLL